MFDNYFLSYLDPFTGSLVLQVIATAFLGAVAFFKPLWSLIRGRKTVNSNIDDWENMENEADTVNTGDSND